ncbi:hypothetical protein [Acidithiobacillus sp.]|uniref:hypothetical protein n=1 Tax=Acidithiobacillus sp. TaxID=1872118 RepID=UPI0035673D7E
MDILKNLLDNGKPFEKVSTNIQGINIVKIPATINKPAKLAIEINPTYKDGVNKKKNGIYLTLEVLDKFRKLVNEPILKQLVEYIDNLNPKKFQPNNQSNEKKLDINNLIYESNNVTKENTIQTQSLNKIIGNQNINKKINLDVEDEPEKML